MSTKYRRVKTFDGKQYRLSSKKKIKTEAKKSAERIRKQGKLVRVSPAYMQHAGYDIKVYGVWVRNK